jgi:membrane associated rhomboid family serine protease
LFPFADAHARQRSFPIVNVTLIALSGLVFLYEIALSGGSLLGGGGNQDSAVFFYKWGFIPEELTNGRAFEVLRTNSSSLDITSPLPTWTTIFSSMFIHGGLLHFAGNMMFLWVFGDNIEDRLGHVKYLLFYLLAGVAAALSQLGVDPHSQVPMVGASGAISGVMGAYLLLYPYNRIKALVVFFFITVMQLPAMYFLGIWFLMQLINGLGVLGLSAQVNVAFFAHIGGFLAGLVLAAGYLVLTGQRVWPPYRPPPDYR